MTVSVLLDVISGMFFQDDGIQLTIIGRKLVMCRNWKNRTVTGIFEVEVFFNVIIHTPVSPTSMIAKISKLCTV